ncbi:unnamed protein product [Lampetra planeri]
MDSGNTTSTLQHSVKPSDMENTLAEVDVTPIHELDTPPQSSEVHQAVKDLKNNKKVLDPTASQRRS